MYQIKITDLAIVEGDQTIARINVLANQAFALKVLSGHETNWQMLTEAITKAIQLIDQNEPTKD